jgi:hypothetical protein
MKVSLGFSWLAPIASSLALSAVVACAAASGEESTLDSDALESSAHHADGGTSHADAGTGGGAADAAVVPGDGGLLSPGTGDRLRLCVRTPERRRERRP